MIITCPACLTKFNLDDGRIPEGGAKVRCSRCQHVFSIPKPSAPEQASPAPDKTPLATAYGDLSPKIPRKVEMPPRTRPARRLPPFTVFLMILLVLCGLVYAFFQVWENPIVPQTIESSFSTLKQYLGVSDETEGFIAFENVKGYYVDNKKLIKVFVIEGRAVNQWKEPRSLIRVKGTLADSKGGKVEEKTAYCGNILLEEDLRSLSREEIANSLSSQFGETFSNVNIPPGKSVPFMIAFTDFASRGIQGNEENTPAAKPGEKAPEISDFYVEVVSSQKGSEVQKRTPALPKKG